MEIELLVNQLRKYIIRRLKIVTMLMALAAVNGLQLVSHDVDGINSC